MSWIYSRTCLVRSLKSKTSPVTLRNFPKFALSLTYTKYKIPLGDRLSTSYILPSTVFTLVPSGHPSENFTRSTCHLKLPTPDPSSFTDTPSLTLPSRTTFSLIPHTPFFSLTPSGLPKPNSFTDIQSGTDDFNPSTPLRVKLTPPLSSSQNLDKLYTSSVGQPSQSICHNLYLEFRLMAR